MRTNTLALIRGVVTDFFADRASQFAAALSFYAAFSLAPLLVLMLTVLAFILDGPQARDYLLGQIGEQLGAQVSDTVANMLDRAAQTQRRGLAAGMATAVMIIGATAVIMSMKAALDHIFGANSPDRARDLWMGIVVARFKAFLMVILLAALLAGSLLFTAVTGGVISAVGDVLPDWVDLAGWTNTGLALALLWLLVYICLRFFPDKPPGPRAAMFGALITTVLLTGGKHVIAWYVGTVGTASAFGAAGALAVFLVWIFFSANFFLLGAECAKWFDRLWPPAARSG
ncbi:MAG: YihY/virulence factor BrkB family protein [Burkholderiaceae bacterium]